MINSIDESGRPGRAIVPGKKNGTVPKDVLKPGADHQTFSVHDGFPMSHITCLSHAFRRTGDLVQV